MIFEVAVMVAFRLEQADQPAREADAEPGDEEKDGEPAVRVFASESRAAGEAAPSVVSAIVEFASGTTSTIESAWTVPERGPQSLAGLLALDGSIDGEAQLLGSLGTARQRLVSDALAVWTDDLSLVPDLSLWPEEDGRVGGALRAEVAYASAVFRRERPNTVVPVEQAVWGVAIAEGMVESARSGQPVTLSTGSAEG